MMNTDHQSAAESIGVMVAKATPPASVSLATISGYHVSELVMWATLIYTVLMIGHKLMTIWLEFQDRKCKCQLSGQQ